MIEICISLTIITKKNGKESYGMDTNILIHPSSNKCSFKICQQHELGAISLAFVLLLFYFHSHSMGRSVCLSACLWILFMQCP